MMPSVSNRGLKIVFVLVLFLVTSSVVTFITMFRILPSSLYASKLGYPDLFPCRYTELRKADLRRKNFPKHASLSCKPRMPLESSCQSANKYFGSPRKPLKPRKCDSIPRDICWFKNKESAKKVVLNCSSHICSSKIVFMAKRDQVLGHVKKWTQINNFTTEKAVSFVKKALKQGETFCFIKCGSITQLLIFPPVMYLKKTINSHDKININIVTFDSLSRSHFYRMLRKSIEALRNVTYKTSLAATVLDFELFQSIGPHTFENIRALFSGVVDGNTEFGQEPKQNSEVGFDVLYQHFQRQGYQTIFQEDLCWYDRWGTLLDNIKMKGGSVPTPERWLQFQKIIKKHKIHHFGITFFSCEVFKKYNDTNHFETPSKVCFNGRFFSSFFFRYLQDFNNAVRNTPKAAPYISYTHFNTAHTGTGLRIGNIDEGLANYISNIGRDPLTWTIFLSDHGHKTTHYVRETLDGKYETFNPLLFMIIPSKAAQILGKERMEALRINQNRLLTTLDVHKGIMSLYDKNISQHDVKTSGMFAKIPDNRMCSDVPLMPLTKCQCFGNEQKYQDNSPKHLWMAEFALGTLNNEIQKQYSEGNSRKGFGNCKRLIGSSFRNIVQTGNLTTFDLHVNASSVGLQQDEIFKIAIATTNDKAMFKSFERQTMYNKFKDCVDKSVSIKLCVCNQEIKKNELSPTMAKMNQKEMQTLLHSPMFKSKTTVNRLNDIKCLFEITRSHSELTTTVEVANVCKTESYNVTVSGRTTYVFVSNSLPIKVVAQPNTIHFLFSASKESSHSYMSISLNAKRP